MDRPDEETSGQPRPRPSITFLGGWRWTTGFEPDPLGATGAENVPVAGQNRAEVVQSVTPMNFVNLKLQNEPVGSLFVDKKRDKYKLFTVNLG